MAIVDIDLDDYGTVDPLDYIDPFDNAEKDEIDDQAARVDRLKHLITVDGNEGGYLLRQYAPVKGQDSFWQPIRRYIMNSYFLPLRGGYSFADELTRSYTDQIIRTLQGEETKLSHDEIFQVLSAHVQIKDIPIDIKFDTATYRFHVRVIESKPDVPGEKFRFVNFSWYGNEIIQDGEISGWEPQHTDELSVAPLDVLRALKQAGFNFQSMMCFSLGNLSFNGLKELSDEDLDLLPKTLILNRGFTSLWKILCKFYTGAWSMWRGVLFQLCALLRMSPDPENGLREHMERIAEMENGKEVLEQLRVLALEATGDPYFSGASALDEDFIDGLKKAGVGDAEHREVYAPGLGNDTQHFAPLDRCVVRAKGDKADEHYAHFTPVASLLADEIFLKGLDEDGYHTCYVVSGNRNPPDTIVAQMLPVYLAILKEKPEHEFSYSEALWRVYDYLKSFFVSSEEK